jgi:hypothetical protein
MNNKDFILPYISKIKASNALEQGFIYNPTKWLLLQEQHRLLLSSYQNQLIKRKGVLIAFQDYFEGKCEVLKPFLLTMIWGFGEAGYGNHRTNIYISTPEYLNLIKTAIDAVKIGDYEKGFKLLKQIKYLGVSYITKVLYFAAKAASHKDYCLIFDIRVSTSLIQLTTPKEIYEMVEIYPSSKYKNYHSYNTLIHQIANDHQLQADELEYFLFDQKFDLTT